MNDEARLILLDNTVLNLVTRSRDDWKAKCLFTETQVNRLLEENRALRMIVHEQSRIIDQYDHRENANA